MTTFLEVANNAVSSLLNGISDSATALDVLSGDGAKFPAAFPFHVSIGDEIIRVDARTADNLASLTRGQEGTSAAAHSKDDSVELRVTALTISALNAAVTALEAASPFEVYIPFGDDPIVGQSFVPVSDVYTVFAAAMVVTSA